MEGKVTVVDDELVWFAVATTSQVWAPPTAARKSHFQPRTWIDPIDPL
jgi:hypothetical protein